MRLNILRVSTKRFAEINMGLLIVAQKVVSASEKQKVKITRIRILPQRVMKQRYRAFGVSAIRFNPTKKCIGIGKSRRDIYSAFQMALGLYKVSLLRKDIPNYPVLLGQIRRDSHGGLCKFHRIFKRLIAVFNPAVPILRGIAQCQPTVGTGKCLISGDCISIKVSSNGIR